MGHGLHFFGVSYGTTHAGSWVCPVAIHDSGLHLRRGLYLYEDRLLLVVHVGLCVAMVMPFDYDMFFFVMELEIPEVDAVV